MRVGVISDIHSNLHALRAVLEELDRHSPDTLVCAGDIVGYGAHPNECCRIVSEAVDVVIEGNHDAAALTGETSRMNPYAAAAAMWTKEALDTDSADFLGRLSQSAGLDTAEGRVSVFHGSDIDRNEYVFEERVDPGMLQRCASRFAVLGHTHVPFVRAVPDGMVVNPGAVGQPRDGDPRASFALLDSGSHTCELARVEYAVEEASEAILKAGLPMMLALRLSVGK
jgi:putative phosphoesterase